MCFATWSKGSLVHVNAKRKVHTEMNVCLSIVVTIHSWSQSTYKYPSVLKKSKYRKASCTHLLASRSFFDERIQQTLLTWLVVGDEDEQQREGACLFLSLAHTAWSAHSEHVLYPLDKKRPTGQLFGIK